MPFDNPKVEVAVPHQEELKIVDKMLEVLDGPGKWCQCTLKDYAPDGSPRYCLIGALTAVDYGMVTPCMSRVSKAGAMVWNRLRDLVGTEVEDFNDDPITDYPDVISVLQRARASFE